MPRIPIGRALALVAAATLIGLGQPTAGRAGQICEPLLVSSPSSPTPSDFAQVLVGEEVLFEAAFPPDTEVTVLFSHNEVIVDELVMTAEADGTLAFVTVFEPDEILGWQVGVEAVDICASIVDLLVVPAGPNVPVSITNLLCPEGIQSADDLADAGGAIACDVAVFEADLPDVPAGFASNVVAASFDFALSSSDGVFRLSDIATLDGGGTCNPGTQTCSFSLSYLWEFVVAGEARLEFFGPGGYRIGHATVTTTSDPPVPVGSPMLGFEAGDILDFEVDDQEQTQVTLYWFANVSAPPPPAPSPSQLPDTTTDGPMAPSAPPLVAAGLLLVLLSAAAYAVGSASSSARSR